MPQPLHTFESRWLGLEPDGR